MKILLFCCLFIYLFGTNQAATIDSLPTDPFLKTGTLPNGLTYYIRHNPASPGYTSFYLVQNVGALLEEDQQNGLAHFLEHMAFNGSLNFPGKSMIRMLERHGITMNRGINAYTSLNETLYGLDNIPGDKKMTDSCLLILHDWSHLLTLDPKAIESERPVILEEWRTRRDADFRLNAQTIPVLLKGSQYAIRDIIGDTAVIRNFQPEELRKFYATWYRPDLQAILIIGDIDLTRTEQQIKTLFTDIPAPENVPSRPFFELSLNEKFSFIQATDPEASQVKIRVKTIQKDPVSQTTVLNNLKNDLETELFNRLMRERFYETFQRQGIPAMAYSLVRHDALQRGYRALTLTLIPRMGDEEKVLKAALTEKERVKRFGFTNEEIKRVQTALLREAETACSAQNKQPNSFYIEILSQHFLENKPIIAPSDYLGFLRQELPHITSEKLIQDLENWDDGSNYFVSATGPEKMTKLDSAQIHRLLLEPGQMDLKPYREQTAGKLMVKDHLTDGKIIKEASLKQFDIREWTLSNGAKVVFKPLDTDQRIALLAFRKGGTSGCSLEELPAASLLPSLVNNYGIGNLDALQLDKILSVKEVNSEINIRSNYDAIAGQAPSAELETLLQTVWLRFEHPRFDYSVHQGIINRFKAQSMTRGQDPFQCMNDTVAVILGNYNPRTMPLNTEQLEGISLQQIQQLYRKKFGDITGFTFLIVGNGEEKQIKKLVEKYIGSLPASGKSQTVTLNRVPLPGWKTLTKTITLPFTEQKSTVLIHLTGQMDYSLKNEYYLHLLRELIELHCFRELREKDGSVYHVTVQKNFEIIPSGKATLMINFDCAPGREQELSGRVNEIFKTLAQKGPQEAELQKVIQNFKTERQQTFQNNQYWINTLFYRYFYKIDKANDADYNRFYTQSTPKACRLFFQKFREKGHQTEFFFQPRQ